VVGDPLPDPFGPVAGGGFGWETTTGGACLAVPLADAGWDGVGRKSAIAATPTTPAATTVVTTVARERWRVARRPAGAPAAGHASGDEARASATAGDAAAATPPPGVSGRPPTAAVLPDHCTRGCARAGEGGVIERPLPGDGAPRGGDDYRRRPVHPDSLASTSDHTP